MRFDIAFEDAMYVVYGCRHEHEWSPSTSVWMIPGTYVE